MYNCDWMLTFVHTYPPTLTGLCRSHCPPCHHSDSHDNVTDSPGYSQQQHHHKMCSRLGDWNSPGPQHGHTINHWDFSTHYWRVHVLLVWLPQLWLAGVHIQWCHGDIHVHIWRYSTLVQLTPLEYMQIYL